jgi:endoribonuclease Dicer
VHSYSLGQSGRYARVRASHVALEKLDGLPPFEFRKKYGCDCVDEGEGELDGKGDEEVMKSKVEQMKEAMGPSI